MSIAVWCFVRQAGEIRALPRTHLDAFYFGTGKVPPDEDGFVRYVQVIVNLRERRAVGVQSVGFFQQRAHADGSLDRKHLSKVMAAIPEAAFPPPSSEQRFAQRRLDALSRWKPTRSERAKLGAAVNRKAGRAIM